MLPLNKTNPGQLTQQRKQSSPALQPGDLAQDDPDLHLLKALYHPVQEPDFARNDRVLAPLRILSYLCLVKYNTQEKGLKIGYFPLINSIESLFIKILKTYPEAWANKEINDFLINLLKYRANNRTGLIAQLNVFKKDVEHKGPGMEILQSASFVLGHCNPEELARTHVNIWGGKNPISPQRGFYTALESCKHLCQRFRDYLWLAQPKMKEIKQERKAALKNQTSSLVYTQLFHTVSSLIQKNTQLNRHQKICIYKSFCRIIENFFSQDNRHHGVGSAGIGLDICDNYLSIISDSATDNVKVETVPQTKELFQSFVPRMGELIDEWLSADHFFMKYCPILMELPLYLKFGDLSKLNSQLERTYRFGEIDQVLCSEVENFAKQKDKDLCLEDIDTARQLLSIMDEFHVWRERLVCGLFNSPLDFAEKCHPHLFWAPREKKTALPAPTSTPSTSSKRKKNKNKLNSAPPVPLKEEAAASGLEDPQPEPVSTIPKEHLYLGEVEVAHKNILESLKKLKGCIKHAEADKALRNAQSHFEHLLCAFGHFIPSLQKGVSRRQLHAFVIDCVRYASLTSEQMLLALASVSNETKIEPSHDLYYLLSLCKFKAGPLPQALRTFIRSSNKGEISIRNLSDCRWEATSSTTQKVPSLDQLLNKLRLFSTGQEAFTPSQILQDTIAFCQFSGQLFYAIETQLSAMARTPQLGFKEIAAGHNEQFSSLCTSLNQLAANVVISDASPPTALLFTRKKLEMLGQDPHLDNVCKHLLPHLDSEIENSNSLNPMRAHLHLCNVLLTNQMIAEEVLLHLNNLKLMFRPSLEDHNLLALVRTLEIPETLFSKEELLFLQSGKAVRQLVRYPAHFNPANSKDNSVKLLEAAAQLFFSQKFTETYAPEDGFQKKKSQVPSRLAQAKEAALQDVALLDSILSKVISALEVEPKA